jgi:hypothetical protein
MCGGFFEVLQLVGPILSAAGQLSRGRQQSDYYEWQARQSAADAQAAREEGEVRAERTRRAGDRQQSEARAALAAAGVEVGAGTPVRIDQQIERDAEWDAQQELLLGRRRGARLDSDAAGYERAADNAMTGSMLAAGATLANGWRPSSLRVNAPSGGAVRIGN